MWPKRTADLRTLLWTLIMPAVAVTQYARPDLILYLFPIGCYLALCAGVIAHNHNHCPTFKSRAANRIFGNWLSLFYGYPTFAWIPTHNLNHHKFVNKAGDATITWRHGNKHNLLTAVTYFFVSSYWQSGPIKTYIRKARETNRRVYRDVISQYLLWGGAAVVTLTVAMKLHGVGRGLLVWLAATALPAFFALWTIMLFNYEQHVHTDPWSPHNHSRSWESKLLNFMLFNNGLHAAHHENAGTHWSDLPAVHARIVGNIDPALVEHSMWWYFTKNYVLAPFFPRFASHQVGRAPFSPPDGSVPVVATADVPLGEAGETAVLT